MSGPLERVDLADILTAVENAPPLAALDVVAERLAVAVGATDVSFLIADFSGHALVRLAHAGNPDAGRTQGRETAETVPLEGSLPGRALTSQRVEVSDAGTAARLCAPVTNRGEAIGVLDLTVPAAPDDAMIAAVAHAAHVLAYVVIANRRFTDLFAWGQRSVPLSLAAEIQHRLLPDAFTCEGGQFTLAGWLEPAGDVGGDTFDYAVERDALHLSITDAVGHSIESAVLATVLVSALRNARRSGADLGEQAHSANAALADFVRQGDFVTGQVARIDLRAQTAEIVNAGHPRPLRLRDGRVEEIALEVDPPFGVYAGRKYRVQTLPLALGDRLIFLTDGMLERNAASVDIVSLIESGAGMHPREAVQHLSRAVLHETGGRLADDATSMCVDWLGGGSGARDTDAGADADA